MCRGKTCCPGPLHHQPPVTTLGVDAVKTQPASPCSTRLWITTGEGGGDLQLMTVMGQRGLPPAAGRKWQDAVVIGLHSSKIYSINIFCLTLTFLRLFFFRLMLPKFFLPRCCEDDANTDASDKLINVKRNQIAADLNLLLGLLHALPRRRSIQSNSGGFFY